MSSRIDKNDVDISKLFYYKDKFEIKGKNGKTITVYMRLVGDAERNQASVFALRESRKLREKLKNPDSDEYLAFIPDFSGYSKAELIQGVLSALTQDIVKKAVQEYKFNLPVEPKSTASLEEQEEYQVKVDEFDEKYESELSDIVQKHLKQEEERLNTLTEEELKNQYLRQLINQLCEYHSIDRFRAMCVYFATFKDENFKQRFFSSFDEFDNLPTDIKEQFYVCYNKLEISETELKK